MTLGLIVGLLVGGSLGAVVMSLLVYGADGDEDMERLTHTCGPKCTPLAGIHRGQWS